MIEIIVYDVFSVADTVSKADGGTFDGNVTMAGTLGVTGIGTFTDDIIIGDGKTIGSASDVDAMTIASNGQVTFSQTLIGTALDISGDIDVDGTTNLDAVDVDGAVNFAADVTFADGADIITASAGTSNFRAGVNAGNSIASGGNYNVVVGDEAGTALTTGDENTAVGYVALTAEDAGSNNTAIGYRALFSQDGADANLAVGTHAGSSISSGGLNTFVGSYSGGNLTLGTANVALGYATLNGDIRGSRSTAVGYGSLQVQSFSSATDTNNSGFGYKAGRAITTGVQNTLIGSGAGLTLTDADQNVAVGTGTLATDTKGNRSVAIGHDALNSQNQTSSQDTKNTAVGFEAGKVVTTGTSNTLIGGGAGDTIQSGNNNVCIGRDSDVNHDTSNGIAIGISIAATDNDFSFGKASNVVTNDFDSDANWSRSSDERLKKNITDQKLGLDFINDLRTVKYNWKPSHELDSTDSQLSHLYKEKEADNEMNTTVTMHNFIAQEVKTALDKAGVSDFAGWKEDQYGVQQVSREMFIIPLVKAMQELSAKNDALEARIKTLEG